MRMHTRTHLHTYTQTQRWDFVVHADVDQLPRDELGVEHRQRLKMQLLKVLQIMNVYIYITHFISMCVCITHYILYRQINNAAAKGITQYTYILTVQYSVGSLRPSLYYRQPTLIALRLSLL